MLFDRLNSHDHLGTGFKTLIKLVNKSLWEEIFTSSAHYLLSLKTDTKTPKLLSTCERKTLIIGFVVCEKSTIPIAIKMLSDPTNQLLTYSHTSFHRII